MNVGRQKDVVLILARELASNLATPMLVLDHTGALIFFNEAAEVIMGAPFATVAQPRAGDGLAVNGCLRPAKDFGSPCCSVRSCALRT